MMLPEKDKTRDRHIGPDTSRKMQDMAHYQFKQRLHASTATRAGKRVFSEEEGYTSLTCGRCGVPTFDLGKDETFR